MPTHDKHLCALCQEDATGEEQGLSQIGGMGSIVDYSRCQHRHMSSNIYAKKTDKVFSSHCFWCCSSSQKLHEAD